MIYTLIFMQLYKDRGVTKATTLMIVNPSDVVASNPLLFEATDVYHVIVYLLYIIHF